MRSTGWINCSIVSDAVLRLATSISSGEFNKLFGKFFDVVGEGGEKQQVLSPSGQECEYPADIPNKSHIQHAIRFVQDQYLDLRKIQGPLLNMVEQTPGGCHQNIDASAELADLGIDLDPAKDSRRFQRQIFAVGRHTLFDLSRKLTGRGKYQSADAILTFCAAAFVQELQ